VLIRYQQKWFREGKYCFRRFIKLLSWFRTKKNSLVSGNSNFCNYSKRVIRVTVVIVEAYRCCQLHTTFFQTFFSLG
jgi:hypothetical protein